MAYDLDWTTSTEPAGGPGELPGKTHIALADKLIDNTSTSLILFGKGSPNYGEKQQENFLRILENFASEVAPPIPTIGQLWWKVYPPGDIRNPILMVCKAISPITWVPVGDPLIRVAYNYEYNRMVELFQKIVGTTTPGTNCADSFGWGQTALAASVTKLYLPTQPVRNPDWLFLLNKWKQIAPVVGVDPARFNSDGFIIEDHFHIEEGPPLGLPGEAKGIATIIDEYELAKQGANDVFANRFNIAASNLELLVYPPINRTTYWTNTISYTVDFTWLSETALVQYFTTGGNLKIIPSLTNELNDSVTNMWLRLFSGLGGGIIIKGCSTVDQAGNPNFSTHVSIFELDNTFKVLYKANEHEVGSGLGAYDSGITDFGTDSDLGWGDITIEARRISPVAIEVKMSFENERYSEVKGLLRIGLESRKLNANLNDITLSPAPVHPNLGTVTSTGLTNIGAPVISGTPTVGGTLTVTPGNWSE